MLGRDRFTRGHTFLDAADAYDAPVRQCHARHLRCRQVGELPPQLVIHAHGQRGIGCDEKRDGIGVMLGLCQEVGGDELRIGARVGKHDELRRTGEGVDADCPRNEMLGGGDIAIARANHDITRGHGSCAVGQRGDRVGAASGEHGIGTCDGGRREHEARRSWARHNHLRDTCDPRRDRGHQHRGGQRIAAAGSVAPGPHDGHDSVTGEAAGDRHHHITDSAALRLRECADPAGNPFQALPRGAVERSQGLLQSRSLNDDRLLRPQLGESLRLPSQRSFAAPAHVLDNLCRHGEGLGRQPPPAALPHDLLHGAIRQQGRHFATMGRRVVAPWRRSSSANTAASDPPWRTSATMPI